MNKRNFLITPVVFLGMLFVCTSCIDAGRDDGIYTQETDSVQTTSDADPGTRYVSEESEDSSDRERANKDKKNKETSTDAVTGNISSGSSAEGDAKKISSGSSANAGEGKTSQDISCESSGKSFSGSSSKKEDDKGNYEGQSQPCSSQSGTDTDTREDKTSTDAASQSEDEVQTECRHSEWEPVYDVIHHDAVTVTEYVDTGKTQTEIVDEVVKKKCRCGELFDTYADWQDHAYPYIDAGLGAQHSGFQDWPVPVYGEVPVYEAKVTTIQEAWDEQCITNYKCRACGTSRW